MDNWYLNNAVYLTEEFLESTKDPYYDGEVDYGDRFEHCWNGDHDQPNAISRLRYQQMFAPKMVDSVGYFPLRRLTKSRLDPDQDVASAEDRSLCLVDPIGSSWRDCSDDL